MFNSCSHLVTAHIFYLKNQTIMLKNFKRKSNIKTRKILDIVFPVKVILKHILTDQK